MTMKLDDLIESREAAKDKGMPWCDHCKCYHDKSAECIAKGATVSMATPKRLNTGEVIECITQMHKAVQRIDALLNTMPTETPNQTFQTLADIIIAAKALQAKAERLGANR